ncbi:LexA family protein [Pseudomonas massiliensis]|uniref:LexA family protein n=1 Tax=Pseudomonas massiliensis TaxID=522492 RepID=UPI00058DD6F8|nr:XRE family transcriptional regulator [Pseudomonas massiliensis]
METWIELVKQKMRERRLTQEQLAERIGRSQGAVNHWLSGRRRPDLDTMNDVLRELGEVNLEVVQILRVNEQRGRYGHQAAAAVPEWAITRPGFSYPVLEWAAAVDSKPSISAYSTGREYVSDYHAKGPAYWLQVEGESMSAPFGRSIPSGALVLVDPCAQAAPGDLVIVTAVVVQEAIFRELAIEGGRRYLRALNPNWPVMSWEDDWVIKGVVVRAMLDLQ